MKNSILLELMQLKNSSDQNEVVVISGLVDARLAATSQFKQLKGLQNIALSLLTGIPRRASNIDYEFQNNFVYQNRGGKFTRNFLL